MDIYSSISKNLKAVDKPDEKPQYSTAPQQKALLPYPQPSSPTSSFDRRTPPKSTKTTFKAIMRDLQDLKPYLYHKSRHNSYYIKFEDERLGPVRIADHQGRQKYSYRWNICLGSVETQRRNANTSGNRRFWYNVKELDNFYRHIRNYHRKILYNHR